MSLTQKGLARCSGAGANVPARPKFRWTRVDGMRAAATSSTDLRVACGYVRNAQSMVALGYPLPISWRVAAGYAQ